MNKGLVGFILGLIAVLGGAFVAMMILKNKLIGNSDNDDFDDFDSFGDPVDDEEFEHFFAADEDEMPEVAVGDSEDEDYEDDQEADEDEEKEEQL